MILITFFIFRIVLQAFIIVKTLLPYFSKFEIILKINSVTFMSFYILNLYWFKFILKGIAT